MSNYSRPGLLQPFVLQFAFDVGAREKHRVEFRFNQDIGNLRINVDGKVVKRAFEMFSFSTIKRYHITVGDAEQHEVLIEKERKRLLGGALPQACTVYIDGVVQGQYGP